MWKIKLTELNVHFTSKFINIFFTGKFCTSLNSLCCCALTEQDDVLVVTYTYTRARIHTRAHYTISVQHICIENCIHERAETDALCCASFSTTGVGRTHARSGLLESRSAGCRPSSSNRENIITIPYVLL